LFWRKIQILKFFVLNSQFTPVSFLLVQNIFPRNLFYNIPNHCSSVRIKVPDWPTYETNFHNLRHAKFHESVIRMVTFSSTYFSCHCGSTEILDCLRPRLWPDDSIYLDPNRRTRPARPVSLLILRAKCTGTAELSPTCEGIFSSCL